MSVTKKALGSRRGAPRVDFAFGSVNVAPGRTVTVQLRLRPRARNFVRSTTKKKIMGRLEIKSSDGVAVMFPAGIRIIK